MIPVLELDDVAVAYGKRRALDGLTLRVLPGEIVTLLVQAIAPDNERNSQTYREVLAAIERIYGAAEISRPAAASPSPPMVPC